jgi:CheY-like chemotaxis protein
MAISLGIFDSSSENRVFSSLEQRLVTWIALEFFAWCTRSEVQLPIMDGYEATRRIKADASLRAIPIIAVTSYALSGEGQKARAAGCDDYVPDDEDNERGKSIYQGGVWQGPVVNRDTGEYLGRRKGYADTGVGKSMFALSAALAVAELDKWWRS